MAMLWRSDLKVARVRFGTACPVIYHGRCSIILCWRFLYLSRYSHAAQLKILPLNWIGIPKIKLDLDDSSKPQQIK